MKKPVYFNFQLKYFLLIKCNLRLLHLDILFSVSPKPEDLILTGIPDDYVEVGVDLNLTCAINRIRPEATGMYWMIGERVQNSTDEQTNDNVDETFSHSNSLQYK